MESPSNNLIDNRHQRRFLNSVINRESNRSYPLYLWNHRYLTKSCKSDGTFIRHIRLSCTDRFCPQCPQARYYSLLRRYLPVVLKYKKLTLLTLTIRNFQYIDKNVLEKLVDDFNKFRRHRYISKRCRGGIYVIHGKHRNDWNPATHRDGWNFHLHILIDADFLDKQKVKEIWNRLADAYMVDIERTDAGLNVLKYVIQYLLHPPFIHSDKGVDVENGLKFLYNRAFGSYSEPDLDGNDCVRKVVRNFVSFGSFYRSDVPIDDESDSDVCPVCSGRDFVYDELDWNDLMILCPDVGG